MGATHFGGMVYSMGVPVLGSLGQGGNTWWVNGTSGIGADGNSGKTIDAPFATIAKAISVAASRDTIYILPKAIAAGATDPDSYAEAVTIPAAKPFLRLIGLGDGPAQGNQPQIKKGSGTAALITIQAPGCTIANLAINGSGSTGGGILLDDDGSTKTAFGTVIQDCFFKNCKGSAACATGGAVQWSSAGNAWQVRISRCHFFNNRGGVVLMGTGGTRPTDLVIEDCTFASDVNTAIDCDIYLAAGSGAQGVIIRRCDFATVDVPGYATAPTAARYLDLTGCEGLVANCTFACLADVNLTELTFGAAGTAAKIPATVRIVGCYGESAVATASLSLVGRT